MDTLKTPEEQAAFKQGWDAALTALETVFTGDKNTAKKGLDYYFREHLMSGAERCKSELDTYTSVLETIAKMRFVHRMGGGASSSG